MLSIEKPEGYSINSLKINFKEVKNFNVVKVEKKNKLLSPNIQIVKYFTYTFILSRVNPSVVHR
jgi:hypothetical protein